MKSDTDAPSLPLEGVTVLEWGEDMASALCGLIMSDLGAAVVLIEPSGGKGSRTKTPPLMAGESALFVALNRGKKSVCLNLATESGRQAVRTLCEDADVVLEGRDCEPLSDLGIEYRVLKAINPKVVYCDISGFGTEGMYAQESASELTIQALTGLSYLGHYTKPPVRVGADLATTMAALCASQAVIAALVERTLSGNGQLVETSLLDGWIQVIGFLAAMWSADIREWMYYAHTDVWSTEDVGFKTKDTPISFRLGAPVTRFQKERWITFCKDMGLERLIDDPWWYEHAAMTIDSPMNTRDVYEEALTKRSSDEMVDYVHGLGGVAAPVHEQEAVWSHPHVRAIGILSEGRLHGQDNFRFIRSPWHFSKASQCPTNGCPSVGEQTREILKSRGYTDRAIAVIENP